MRSSSVCRPLVLTLLLVGALRVLGEPSMPGPLAAEVGGHVEQARGYEAQGNLSQAAFHYHRAATLSWVNGFAAPAVGHFQRAIDLNQRIGNQNALLALHTNLGMLHADEEAFDQALASFGQALSIGRRLGRKPDIASALMNMASAHTALGQYPEAAQALQQANALARELNDERLIRNSFSQLAQVHERLGNPERSAEYFALYSAISRKIQRDEMRRREGEARQLVTQAQEQVSAVEAQRRATEEELGRKEETLRETEQNLERVEVISRERQMQIDLLNKEKELQAIIIQNQRLVRNVFVAIILAVLAFALLIYYNLRLKKRANRLLHQQNVEIASQRDMIERKNLELSAAFERINKQNRDITSSINYAQRIQEALLPSPEALAGHIPDSFIILKPRNIVSGDFFWFLGYRAPDVPPGANPRGSVVIHNLPAGSSGVLISAVDCTGHGVPGAFMSMIGFNLLETIARGGELRPNRIMEALHRAIRYLLKQERTDNRDGMDMALCHIAAQGRRLEYAGAKNPLIAISNGQLRYIKGNPVPIGGSQKEEERAFTLHSLEIDSPTCFYIFSDGLVDQFGGPLEQKYGTKQLQELLLRIHTLPMAQQKEIIEQQFAKWMGHQKQVDDVVVIGFRLGA